MKKILLPIIMIAVFSSCSTTGTRTTKIKNDYSSIEELIQSTDLDEDETLPGETGRHKIPTVINESVAKWISYFTENESGKAWFQRALTRSEEYETDMKNILISAGVPEELFYLAFIESGFVQRSRSHAGAVGIWQFMPGTARLYGLKVSRGKDDRLVPHKSCAAAAAYLKDLYNLFGSWYLAMASYNAGEGRIRNAILRHGERNFWELASKNALPSETMNYVPKFIAAVIVAENWEKFGFAYNGPSKGATTVAEDVKNLVAIEQFRRGSRRAYQKDTTTATTARSYDSATVHTVRKGENLSGIARKYSTSINTIKKCNNIKGSSIRIGQRLALDCDRPTVVASGTTQKSSKPRSNIYKVRRGDTLDGIARKYKLTAQSIADCNPTVKRYQILAGQRLILTCEPSSEEVQDIAVASEVKKTPAKKDYIIHKVKSGESLWSIARKYDVSISEIMEWNKLNRRNVIFKGRKLRIYNQ